MNKIKGFIFITLAIIFFIAFAATIGALILSFTVESTLSAVESIFGSLVLSLCLLVLGLKAYRAGKANFSGKISNKTDESKSY